MQTRTVNKNFIIKSASVAKLIISSAKTDREYNKLKTSKISMQHMLPFPRIFDHIELLNGDNQPQPTTLI